MKAIYKKLPAALAIAAAGILGLGSGAAQAQGKTITLCWAAWDPANALVELSKEFTAKTKVNMKFEFVPWPNFADRMLNELNSKGKLCDVIIGDSQWIGGAAESGHYVKLNDFFAKEGIKMSDFMPATVLGYSEWPKGTPNYWALPAMGDALGWTYRKDWFARPDLRAEFKKKYNRELEAPKTWADFKQVAEFFTRTIDGKKVYGTYLFTERGSEGITMGVSNVLYPYGFKYEDPKKHYAMDGFVNGPDAVKGLEFYKELSKCCTPPGRPSYGRGLMRSVGQVAMMMKLVRLLQASQGPNVGGDKIGFVNRPGRRARAHRSSAARAFGGVFAQPRRGAQVHRVVRPSTCRRSGGRSAATVPRRCCGSRLQGDAPFAAEF
jgi:multiple sugar transport system substrate-binding protein